MTSSLHSSRSCYCPDDVGTHDTSSHGINLQPNLLYKSYQIPKLDCFLSRLAVEFALFCVDRCYVENEDVFGAGPTVDGPAESK